MRILIVTGACKEQVINGVVRTLEQLKEELKKLGHTVNFITPVNFLTVPLPKYNDIKIALNVWPKVGRMIQKEFEFAKKNKEKLVIHIATEDTLGYFARRYCLKNNLKFTTSYHTSFDKYIKLYAPFIPIKIPQKFLKNFHSAAYKTLVTTKSMKEDLKKIGFDPEKLTVWTRGANHGAFKNPRRINLEYKRPIWLYVGRVSIEKNIRAFLNLDLEGTKIVVGKGPDLKKLKQEFPNVIFKGEKTNGELASYFASADVFVMPSLTDTFGIVIIEGLQCGTPVAAYPVTGPKDILEGTNGGVLNKDLKVAALEALKLNRDDCKEIAKKYTWENCAKIFLANTAPN